MPKSGGQRAGTDPQVASDEAAARVIKRYANRKLYDTADSRYVTLEEIAQHIRAGDDVRVVDNVSGEDLTAVTLTQIILDAERKTNLIPLGTLLDVIRSRGQSLGDIIGRRGGRRGDEGEESPGVAEEMDEALLDAPGVPGGNGHAGNGAELQDPEALLSHGLRRTEGMMDEVERSLDQRVSTIFQNLAPFAGLRRKLTELTERVSYLEGRLRELGVPIEPPAPETDGAGDEAEVAGTAS